MSIFIYFALKFAMTSFALLIYTRIQWDIYIRSVVHQHFVVVGCYLFFIIFQVFCCGITTIYFIMNGYVKIQTGHTFSPGKTSLVNKGWSKQSAGIEISQGVLYYLNFGG